VVFTRRLHQAIGVLALITATSVFAPNVLADETSLPLANTEASGEQIKAEALEAAEDARRAAERSGTIPPLIPFGADPANPNATSAPQGLRPHQMPDYLEPADPNATELEQVERAIRRRAITGDDKRPHCYYGPITRRVSVEQMREISDYGETDAAWNALLALEEDPNLPGIEVIVRAPGGPTCNQDLDKELWDRREELLKQPESNR
jgi:hypothetical protein